MNYSSQEKSPYLQPPPVQPTNIIYVQSQVGPDPMRMTCPHCQASITTKMEAEPSNKTHLLCLLLCCLGCCCCAPLVYCTDSCLAKKHFCPNCNQFLGAYDS